MLSYIMNFDEPDISKLFKIGSNFGEFFSISSIDLYTNSIEKQKNIGCFL